MAYLDLSTFTQAGTPVLTISPDEKVSWAVVEKRDDVRLYYDFGEGYFGGFDWTIEWDSEVTDTDGTKAYPYFLVLSNGLGDMPNIASAYNYIAVFVDCGGPYYYLYDQVHGGATGSDYNWTNHAHFWYTLNYEVAVGAYGTLTLIIYNDAERTSVKDTLVVACGSVPNYRYMYAFNSQDGSGSGDDDDTTGYSQNFELTGFGSAQQLFNNNNITALVSGII